MHLYVCIEAKSLFGTDNNCIIIRTGPGTHHNVHINALNSAKTRAIDTAQYICANVGC